MPNHPRLDHLAPRLAPTLAPTLALLVALACPPLVCANTASAQPEDRERGMEEIVNDDKQREYGGEENTEEERPGVAPLDATYTREDSIVPYESEAVRNAMVESNSGGGQQAELDEDGGGTGLDRQYLLDQYNHTGQFGLVARVGASFYGSRPALPFGLGLFYAIDDRFDIGIEAYIHGLFANDIIAGGLPIYKSAFAEERLSAGFIRGRGFMMKDTQLKLYGGVKLGVSVIQIFDRIRINPDGTTNFDPDTSRTMTWLPAVQFGPGFLYDITRNVGVFVEIEFGVYGLNLLGIATAGLELRF